MLGSTPNLSHTLESPVLRPDTPQAESVPCGTVTSFPSTVNVMSACREDVDDMLRISKDRRRQWSLVVNPGIRNALVCEPTTFPMSPVEVGLATTEAMRSILTTNLGDKSYGEWGH